MKLCSLILLKFSYSHLHHRKSKKNVPYCTPLSTGPGLRKGPVPHAQYLKYTGVRQNTSFDLVGGGRSVGSGDGDKREGIWEKPEDSKSSLVLLRKRERFRNSPKGRQGQMPRSLAL